MAKPITDNQQLCIHTITTKPWSLAESLEQYAKHGIGGISIWQDAAQKQGFAESRRLLEQSDIEVVSYVRGGFFPHADATERAKAIDHNKKMVDEAAELGAPLLVLVCGAHPDQSLATSRDQIRAGIEAVLPHAEAQGVRLGIEPLHPMYADTRSAINTLATANAVAEAVDHDFLGVVVDVYHLWWEEALEQEIYRCGNNNNLFAFHICDWKYPPADMLNDRGLMGEGCIPVQQIRGWVEAAGFNGFNEVEIFSNRFWQMDQEEFLQLIIQAYHQHS